MTGRGLRLAIGALGTILAIAAEALSFQGGQTPSAGLLHLAIGRENKSRMLRHRFYPRGNPGVKRNRDLVVLVKTR